MYDNLNMIKTGALLKRRIEDEGYTVRGIQNIQHLSCPQPIYRGYKEMVKRLYEYWSRLQVKLCA